MKTAIITGATGFIGSHLCSELISNGAEVTALVRNNVRLRLPKSVKCINCDMDAYSTLDIDCADVFYHLAWEGTTGVERNDEALQLKNAQRTLEAMKLAKKIGCKRFVALGTVYEKLYHQIILDSEHRQADFYLLSKHYAHNMCAKLAAKLKIDFVWATIFQPIGKYIKKEQVMSYAIDGLLKGVSPTFGPAQVPYDVTAVENIAHGLYLLGEKDALLNEYYIGGGSPRRLADYLKEIRDILGVSTDLGIGERPDDGLNFSFDWYDIAPLIRDTGYSPIVSFEEAVRYTAAYLDEKTSG